MKNQIPAFVPFMAFTLLLVISFWGFRSAQPLEETELMTIVIREEENSQNMVAHISINGKSFLQEELAVNTYTHQGDFDFNPVIKLMVEYQRGGWKIVGSSMDMEKANSENKEVLCYFFLERTKPQNPKK